MDNTENAKIDKILQHLSETERGQVAANFIDQFKLIEEKFRHLEANEQDIFASEYTEKLHKAFDTLDNAVNYQVPKESDFTFYLITACLIVLLFICG